MRIVLISIYSNDQTMKDYYSRFLYELLAEREPYQNISHKKMPTYEEHINFINSRPYKEWFVVYATADKKRVGSIYLSKDNEIGIFLSKKEKKKGYGRRAVNSLMEYFNHVREFKANIAPFNSTSLAFFINMGFKYESLLEEGDKIIQYTYKIVNPYYVEIAQEEVEALQASLDPQAG